MVMGMFYKEFGLKKVLECGVANSWKELEIGKYVYLTNK